MQDIEAVRRLMMDAVPFNRVLGVQVETVEAERAVVVLSEAEERLNHVGTVHAAAQFGLGEAASGSVVVGTFSDLLEGGMVPLVTTATIRYRRGARGELRGIAHLPAAEQQRIRDDIAQVGRARFTVPVEVQATDGMLTSELEVEWILLKQRS